VGAVAVAVAADVVVGVGVFGVPDVVAVTVAVGTIGAVAVTVAVGADGTTVGDGVGVGGSSARMTKRPTRSAASQPAK
jgi:hypothetical protein